MTKTIHEKMVEVQKELKAPKGQTNKFGNYNYRSAEDIVEAVKPLLHARSLIMTISDDIVEVGGRIYVEATVRILAEGQNQIIETKAYAREAETKKGMDESQITGAASSYARKYALNGMFAIDDTKDADATNDHGKKDSVTKDLTEEDYTKEKQQADFDRVMTDLCQADDLQTLTKVWTDYGRRVVNGLKAVGNEKYRTVSEKYTTLKMHFEGAR